MRHVLLTVAILAACTPYPPARTPTGTTATPVPDSLEIIVAGTTDVHGWLRGWDYFTNAPDTTRGLTRAATVVDSIRSANPDRVVLVDAGDLLQGTPLTSIALRDSLGTNPIIAAMNAMRYDAAVIGNHEFNYGLSYLARAISQARFPFLAANAYRSGNQPAYPAYTMVQRGGVRIAIVGGTTPGSMIWDRDKLRGSVEIRDIVPGVTAAVEQARAQGADVVVAVLHSGLGGASSYDETATGLPPENVAARVAREVPGIDVLVFGHSHRELADTTIGATLLTQPRNWAGSVSVVNVAVVRSAGSWRVASRRGRVIRVAGRAEHAGVVAAVGEAHERTISFVASPIGTTPVAWRSDSARVKDTPIVDFVLETTRRRANADLASVAAFSLNADFGPGPITVADMAALYPYENNVLRVIRISGMQLREYIEFSARYFRHGAPIDSLIDPSIPGFNYDIVAGVDYVLDISRPIGARVVSLTRDGRAVADTDTFTLALHDYRQQGGGGYAMIQGAPIVYDQQEQIRQLLIDEIRQRGVIRPEDYFVRNWRIVPDSLAGAAYRSMRRLPYDLPRPAPTGAPR